VLVFIFVSPELKPNKITDVEVKNKSSIGKLPQKQYGLKEDKNV
jgi:hypothetical protein